MQDPNGGQHVNDPNNSSTHGVDAGSETHTSANRHAAAPDGPKASSHTSQGARQATMQRDATPDGDWEVMERELAEWGRLLDRLRKNAHLVGTEMLEDLETRYEEIKGQAHSLREEAEEKVREAKQNASEQREGAREFVEEATVQAKRSFDHLSAQAKAHTELAAENIKDVSEKLWIGAQEMGDGFRRAWVELRQGFESASEKIQENDGPTRSP